MECQLERQPSEYWRLFHEQKVRKSIMVWENPLAESNIEKMVKSKDIVGQYTLFDNDVIYWRVKYGKIKRV